MPMCDIYIQDGALEPEAEAKLVARVSHILSSHEVRSMAALSDSDDVQARVDRAESIAWMFVHRTDTYVAGKAVGPSAPRGPVYKFDVTIPEGLIDDIFIPAVNREILQALTEAEAGRWRHPELRLWVLVKEVKNGAWGAAGRPFPLHDIVEYVAEGWGDKAVERWQRKLAEQNRTAGPAAGIG